MTLSTKELIEAMKDIVITDEMEQKLRDRLEKSRLEMAVRISVLMYDYKKSATSVV